MTNPKKTISRKDVPKKDAWNTEALYPSMKAWEADFTKVIHRSTAPFFPELDGFNGKLHKSAKTLKDLLECYFSIERKLRKLYTYAHLRHDEDIANEAHKKQYDKIGTMYHEFAKEACWIEPEILAIDKKTLQKYRRDPLLQEYAFYLEKLFRQKPHTLSEPEEKILALAGLALETPHKAFSSISDADFKFGSCADKADTHHELTHATYGLYIRSQDRTLRKNAFETLLGKYGEFGNSLTELLAGQLQKHLFFAKARNYTTCLEAALQPKNIDPSVYFTLIDAVHDNIHVLHAYMALRKKALKLKELHLYDTAVPFVQAPDMKFSYEEAEDLVIESTKPLGTHYQNILKDGLKSNRWVDRYENIAKRSGAYSSGCYDSMPYILMNFKGILRDVFTLAHEAGHSMHSYFSRTSQPYHYSDYAIFVAEVASTFNEELLNHTLLQNAKTKLQKAFLINEKLEDIRATLFRQTMFAEFELKIHSFVEARTPITPELLKHEYRTLNEYYFGKGVHIDPAIAIEWARIPHFYYGFYVYQYATGISAAIQLAEGVLHGGRQEQNRYLDFLKMGGSKYPLEILKKAGCDLTTVAPVTNAIAKFATLTKELAKLL